MKKIDKKKELLFKIEEQKEDETILQTGKIWCEDCAEWIDHVEKKDEWLCCSECGLGLIILT